MNGEGKKHTLRFDPRTELLLLVLANIVAFTQHDLWVEILCIPKRAENFSQQLHDHCILCKKDFPLFDCRYDGFTENARPGIDGCTSEMAYPAGIDYSFVCNRPIFSGLERRNRLYPGCHEAP